VVIVADDTDRIVAAGQEVLDLLGYQEPDWAAAGHHHSAP
jgi:hypothetical protein